MDEEEIGGVGGPCGLPGTELVDNVLTVLKTVLAFPRRLPHPCEPQVVFPSMGIVQG